MTKQEIADRIGDTLLQEVYTNYNHYTESFKQGKAIFNFDTCNTRSVLSIVAGCFNNHPQLQRLQIWKPDIRIKGTNVCVTVKFFGCVED